VERTCNDSSSLTPWQDLSEYSDIATTISKRTKKQPQSSRDLFRLKKKAVASSAQPSPGWNQPPRFFEIIDLDETLLLGNRRAHQDSNNNRRRATLLARLAGLRLATESLRSMLVSGTPQRRLPKTVRDLIDRCIELLLLLALIK
jgi:hypothetical protein